MSSAVNSDIDPDLILKKLKQLFLYYSSISSQDSSSFITPQKFLKLLKDSEVPDRSLKPQDLEILILSGKKKQKQINFDLFCSILIKISKSKYANSGISQSATSTLYALLNENILPLLDALIESGKITQIEEIDSTIDEECIEIINSAYEVLKEIYRNNFVWELISSEEKSVISQRSRQTFMAMLNNFNIIPDLLTPVAANKLWQEIAENSFESLKTSNYEDLGKVFTLKKFVVFLLRSAMIGNYAGRILSSSEKLSIFLEKLQMSDGFSRIDNRLCRPHSENMSFLSDPKVIDLLNGIAKEDIKLNTISSEAPIGFNISEQMYIQLELHMEKIESVFRLYCSWGNHMNANKLNSSNFIRLLTSAEIIGEPDEENKITRVDANLIFVSVTHKKNKTNKVTINFKKKSYLGPKDNDFGKMSFQQFLKALEIISGKVYQDLPQDQAFLSLIENRLLVLDFNNSTENYLKGLLSIVRDPSMSEIYSTLRQTLSPYIRLYLDEKSQLDFPQAVKFCTDFSIFPNVITKAKLTPIFYCLADIYSKNSLVISGTQSLTKSAKSLVEAHDTECINNDLFIDLIAMVSIEGNQSEKSSTEKICIALEKISQSKGPSLIPLMTGSPRTAGLHRSDYLMMVKKEEKKQEPVISFREVLLGRIEEL
ncbi:unnamed protein product [Blepharisma stoltei]|uniref:Uncharacterized protein n=1 Tax=Blepharisma stoltei TaxID=1481888 RepID=A0AAU9J083_9CILI|nr:unnamed protein product [Blepharisma stoltei]